MATQPEKSKLDVNNNLESRKVSSFSEEQGGTLTEQIINTQHMETIVDNTSLEFLPVSDGIKGNNFSTIDQQTTITENLVSSDTLDTTPLIQDRKDEIQDVKVQGEVAGHEPDGTKDKPPKPEYEPPLFTCSLTDGAQIVIGIAFLLLLLNLVPISAVQNARMSLLKTNSLAHGIVNPLNLKDGFEGVIILANVTKVEPKDLKCTVRYAFIPVGTFAARGKSSDVSQFSSDVTFVTERNHITISDSEMDPAFEITYPITGLSVKYPFETYYTDWVIGLYTTDGTSIPIAFGMIASKQSWWGVPQIKDMDKQIGIALRFDQSWMTKIYAILVSFIMWVLTLTLLTMTYLIFSNNAKAESGIMRLAIRLLFAFPAMRRNQPNVVEMGSTQDVLSFFWCVCLCSICMYLLMSNVVGGYITEKISDDKRMFTKVNTEESTKTMGTGETNKTDKC